VAKQTPLDKLEAAIVELKELVELAQQEARKKSEKDAVEKPSAAARGKPADKVNVARLAPPAAKGALQAHKRGRS
jgi:hypothetical protein